MCVSLSIHVYMYTYTYIERDIHIRVCIAPQKLSRCRIVEQLPNHRRRNLKAFEEHIQQHVS